MARRLQTTAPVAALALVLALSSHVCAGAPTEALHDVFSAVNRVLETPELQDKPLDLLAAIRNVVNDSFDFREAARLAMGREWEAMTETERDEFVRLFADLFEHGYIARLAARANVQGGLAIRYRGETTDGDRASVVTGVSGRNGDEIPLEYRMLRARERWAVYDVLLDGVSLVDNYRAQFSRVIRRSSYPELLAQMKAKMPDTPSGPSAAAQDAVSAPAPHPASPSSANPPVVARRRDAELELVPRDERAPAQRPLPERAAPARAVAYWIQVGAFKNPKTAGGLAAQLLEQNLPVSIDSVTVPAGQRRALLSRVRVGPFADRAEAAAKLQALQTNGYQPFIAREHN